MALVSIDAFGVVKGVISDMAAVFIETTGHFEDNDDRTYTKQIIIPAKIVYQGTEGVRQYFTYNIGEIVAVNLCPANTLTAEKRLFYEEALAQGLNMYDAVGIVYGAIYTGTRHPPAYAENIRMIDFGCGSITVNLEDKTLDIDFEGEISIRGKEIYLNG